MTNKKSGKNNKQSVDSTLFKKIEELEEKLLQATEKAEQAESKMTRALADLANFQCREKENRGKWSEMAVVDFLKGFLKNFFELSLATEHCQDKDLQKVVHKFSENLAKIGLEKIYPQAGEPINPELHEVLMVAEGKPGTVVQVLEPGWKFKNRVIQPAKVSGAMES